MDSRLNRQVRLLLVCALALTAWDGRAATLDAAVAREVELGQPFQLKAGEETGFKGSPLRVRLLSVTGGRCPPQVNCLVKPPDTAVVAISWGKVPGPELALSERRSSPAQHYRPPGTGQYYDVYFQGMAVGNASPANAGTAVLRVTAVLGDPGPQHPIEGPTPPPVPFPAGR
jgi:hypothetical protein